MKASKVRDFLSEGDTDVSGVTIEFEDGEILNYSPGRKFSADHSKRESMSNTEDKWAIQFPWDEDRIYGQYSKEEAIREGRLEVKAINLQNGTSHSSFIIGPCHEPRAADMINARELIEYIEEACLNSEFGFDNDGGYFDVADGFIEKYYALVDEHFTPLTFSMKRDGREKIEV